GEQRRCDEGGTDDDGDAGGREPSHAPPHLGDREDEHQALVWVVRASAVDSKVRRASRPASTDSGVGLSISPAIRPSAMRTTRSAYAAATGSCVTMMMVRPSSRTERRRKLST